MTAVLDELGELRRALSPWWSRVEPEDFSGDDALRIATEVGALGNVVQLARASFAHHAADVGSAGSGEVGSRRRQRRKKGSTNATPTAAAKHVAFMTGQSAHELQRDINCITQLADAPDVAREVAEGLLSLTQASLISPAAIAQPHMTARLLRSALRRRPPDTRN